MSNSQTDFFFDQNPKKMQSFRTEIENPLVEKDIIDLEKKIRLFKEGKIDEEKFRSLRLARGVYGQRQFGVQMIRIKLPYGKVTSEQIHRIADVSDEYSTGRLHITTRQDIQIHHVSLDRTPELWAELEKDNITLREACGNTVRNVTASPDAGIDPEEAFDVTPYADAVFKYFLRSAYGQEMGRKFKISFSGSDQDSALSYMHDLGFIAKTKIVNGAEIRGFKVLLAGGLGSQPRQGDVIYEFLETNKVIPLIEGTLRIFDRHGERANRNKARVKFLVKKIGVEAFLQLIKEEQKAIENKSVEIEAKQTEIQKPLKKAPKIEIKELAEYNLWKATNVFKQKQSGLLSIGIRIPLGDFYTDKARKLADLIKTYGGNELRFTLRQDILLRNIPEEALEFFYLELKKMDFIEPGFESTLDITACPGTDTCNLGIASSTGITKELEKVIKTEYPEYLTNKDLTIKISGCMNACGQHSIAHIGFQGMTIKVGEKLAPALQVLIGGGTLGDGQGRFSDKVIKIPSKRGPEALRILLDDFDTNGNDQSFHDYYDQQGKAYFYELLKPLSLTENLVDSDFVDWGHDKEYVKAIGIGECAGVVIDLVSTLFFETEEKLQLAKEALDESQWSDSIYYSYAAIINSAKALLVAKQKKTNSYAKIISDFDTEFVEPQKIGLPSSFSEFIYQIRENEPSIEFAFSYFEDAQNFYKKVDAFRLKTLKNEN